MVRHPSEFMQVQKSALTPGKMLEVNLYVYLPENKSILYFRRSGEVIGANDYESLQKIPDKNLLIPRSEHKQYLLMLSREMNHQIQTGSLNSPAVKQGAGAVLGSITASRAGDEKPSGEVAREILATVPKLVESMVLQFKRTPSLETYEAILNSIQGSEDILEDHHRKVSALAVLIMLTVDQMGNDELVHLGTAGLVHDMGLKETTKILLERHVIGDEEFTASEKIIYMRHPEMTSEALRKNKIIVSPRVHEIINDHHENWDGSGFKAISGGAINVGARVLRIADDIVGCISHPKNHLGFKEALAHITARGTQFARPTYDPTIVNKLGESLGIGDPVQFG